MGACAFSLDQLMELAGLSVSQAGGLVYLLILYFIPTATFITPC